MTIPERTSACIITIFRLEGCFIDSPKYIPPIPTAALRHAGRFKLRQFDWDGKLIGGVFRPDLD